MTILGIDPGLKGGLCFVGDTVVAYSMPIIKNHGLDVRSIRLIVELHRPKRVYVEHAFAMPRMNVKAVFSYAMNFGRLLSVLEALDLAYVLVPPQVWQKHFSFERDKKNTILGTHSRKVETKLIARRRASELEPGNGLRGDGQIDAFLIAKYGQSCSS